MTPFTLERTPFHPNDRNIVYKAEIESLQSYLSTNQESIQAAVDASSWNPGAIFLREKTGLARSFVKTETRTYSLLNRVTACQDRLVGENKEGRKITVAICLEDGRLYASSAEKCPTLSKRRFSKRTGLPLDCLPLPIQTALDLGKLSIMTDWVAYIKKLLSSRPDIKL